MKYIFSALLIVLSGCSSSPKQEEKDWTVTSTPAPTHQELQLYRDLVKGSTCKEVETKVLPIVKKDLKQEIERSAFTITSNEQIHFNYATQKREKASLPLETEDCLKAWGYQVDRVGFVDQKGKYGVTLIIENIIAPNVPDRIVLPGEGVRISE